VVKPVRVKQAITWSASVIFAVLLLSVVLPFLVKPAVLQDFLSRQFRERTGFDIRLERPSLLLLPLPTFRFHNIEIRNPDQAEGEPFLTLEEFQCQLKILPLLIKRIDLSKVVLKNANFKWPVVLNANEPAKIVELKNVSAVLSNVKSNGWMKLDLSGKWLSDERNLSLQGKAKIDFDHPDPAGMSWTGQVTLKTTPLKQLLREFGMPVFDFVDSGTVAWDGKLEKTAVSPEVLFQGALSLNDLVYRIHDSKTSASEKASYRLDLDTVYDLNSQVLTFKPTTVSSSFMNLKINGGIDLKAGKANELHFELDPITWDKLPNYVLPIAKLMPVNFGFSGTSRFDVVMSGTWNQLAVHASGNLTDALFSYSRYFEKPKSVPLLFQSDRLEFKDGRVLDGELDISLNQAKLKGSFVKFDTLTGLGEMTLMTNQFMLSGWEKMAPTFSDYELSGALKFFLNVKNKAKAEEDAKSAEPKLMYHIAFDTIGIRTKTGDSLIENLSGSIDAGPMDLEAKKFSFQIGDTHFTGQAAMFFQEIPRLIANLESPNLDLRSILTRAVPVARLFGIDLKPEVLAPIQKSIESIIKPNVKLENFVTDIGFESNRVALKNLSFELYEGKCRANGSLDLNPVKPLYIMDVEIEKMSLARISENNLQSPVEGNLFLVTHLEGEGFAEEDIQTKLNGEGTLSLTNGEFKTMDLLGSMAVVAQLAGLGESTSGRTRFQDVNSKFKISGGKINTDHFLLYSDDLKVDAAGDIDFKGNLNFRLQASLSNAMSRKINPSISSEEQIGPIPLILTGTLEKPSLKPDPALIQNFIINLAKEKFQKLFPSQASGQKTELQAGSETSEIPLSNPLADLMRQGEGKQSNSEKAVQTGMALLESLLKKPE